MSVTLCTTMIGTRSDTAPDSTLAAEDSRLRCPQCGYNLTGLTQPRCPECGATFDWEEVRRTRDHAPRIAFERARGWRKFGAFFVTWATVLFAPWIFARQVVGSFSLRHALLFGLLCFAPVTARYVVDISDWETYFPWILTAAAYIALQAALLTALDPTGWRAPRAAFRFWLAVGCYTTAIVATEFWEAAPLLEFSSIRDWIGGSLHGDFDPADLLNRVWGALPWLGWLQIGVWLVGVACCYWRRLHAGGVRRSWRLLATPAVVVLLLLLYAIAVERIGENLLYERVFNKIF